MLILLISFINLTHSQKRSLDSVYLEKIYKYVNIKNDSSLFYIKLLEKSENICLKLNAKSAKNYILYREEKYIKVEEECLKVKKTIDSLKAKNLYIDCLIDRELTLYNRLFWIKKNQEDYCKAYEYLLEIEKLNNKRPKKILKDYRDYLGIQTQKAIIKNIFNEHNEALNILQKTYSNKNNPILKPVQNSKHLILWKTSTLNSIGNTYLALGKEEDNFALLDSANVYYDKAYKIAKNLNHKDSKVLHAFNLTKVLMAKKEFKKP